MKQLCVFDLDGTLVDSIQDIASAMNQALTSMGKPVHPVVAYYQMVGNGLKVLCMRAFPDGTEAEVEALYQRFLEIYNKACCHLTKPYPGIVELLGSLKQNKVRIAVLSNKPHVQAVQVVETLFGKDCFSVIMGQSDAFPVKPNPASLFHLMNELGVTPRETCYIGDSDVDIQFGIAANVDAIGVAWGFRGTEELKGAGAKKIAACAKELEQILLEKEF